MPDKVLFVLGFVYFLLVPFSGESFLVAIALGLVAQGIWHLIVRRHRAQIATPAFAKSLDYVTIAQRGPSPRRERQRPPVVETVHTVGTRVGSAQRTSPGLPARVPSPIGNTAQRDRSSDQRRNSAAVDFDAVEALAGLGFSKRVAVSLLLASASSDLNTTEQKVLAALRATAAPSLQGDRRPS